MLDFWLPMVLLFLAAMVAKSSNSPASCRNIPENIYCSATSPSSPMSTLERPSQTVSTSFSHAIKPSSGTAWLKFEMIGQLKPWAT